MELWTSKYKPLDTKEILSQSKPLKEVGEWLDSWKRGEAVIFHGSPGCGKTLVAEVLAKERGFLLCELNASDNRTQGSIESFTQTLLIRPLFHKGKIVLVDELDGISSRERGAASAMLNLIKHSFFPVIFTANDPWLPKLRGLRSHCRLIKFNKVHSLSIEKRLKQICSQEGIAFDNSAIKNLARWSSGDMRSAINDLQIVAQGKEELCEKDLEILGYRERESQIFSTLQSLFNSGRINASRKAISESNKDVDEIFWWVEMNMEKEFREDELARAYKVLAAADLFRSLVTKQQNWRFKAFMKDMLAGVSLFKKEHDHFSQYRPPDRFLRMGRNKARRLQAKEVASFLGERLHASNKVIRNGYFPYLKLILSKDKKFADGFLDKEYADFIRKY